MYLKLIKENQKITTHNNRSGLETLQYWLIMSKIFQTLDNEPTN